MASQDTRIGRARERARQARWILAVAALAGFGWAFAFAKGSSPGASTVEQDAGSDPALGSPLVSDNDVASIDADDEEDEGDDDRDDDDLSELDDFFGGADVGPAPGSGADRSSGPASHAS